MITVAASYLVDGNKTFSEVVSCGIVCKWMVQTLVSACCTAGFSKQGT
jgi:formate/nitrite transporter FocA (FNT family)